MKKKKSRIIPVLLSLGIAAIAIASILAYRGYASWQNTALPYTSEKIFVVTENMSAAACAQKLREQDIIDNLVFFRLLLTQKNVATKLKIGTYVFEPGLSPERIIAILSSEGPNYAARIAVLPGENLYDIAEKLHKHRFLDRERWLKLAVSPEVCARLGIPSNTVEGYLAPGEYEIHKGQDVEDVFKMMHARFIEHYKNLAASHPGRYEKYRDVYHMADHEIITLASMVQKEAVLKSEMPIIARVFLNRINKKMKFQSDPTCVYPPKFKGEKPSPTRCKDKNNIYSTYVIPGLPPTPIAFVSKDALLAVFKPYDGEAAERLLYFAAKNDGSRRHYFSSNYAEHNDAVNYFIRKKAKKMPKGTKQPY